MKVVFMKAAIDLFDQFRCSLKVYLSGMNIHVTHIGCQPWEPGVDILTVPIPSKQPVNSKSVAKVVHAWATVFAVTNSALPHQVAGGLIDGALMETARSLVEEEGGVGRAGSHLQALAHVSCKGSAGGIAQGDPTVLFEFAFGDEEAFRGDMEVVQVQGQCLTDPDPCAV